MRSRKRCTFAPIGLLVVAAITMAAGSGRKPPTEQQVTVSSRHVSTSEATDILRKFPELIPGFLASERDDAEYMARIFGFVEVAAAPLARVFPSARFYIGHYFYSTSQPYLMAIAGGKRYSMPAGFNLLLMDTGQKATNKNIIELADAFIVAAICNTEGLSTEVTFLGASKAKHVISGGDYDASLKVRIGQQIEEWSFSLDGRGQLGTVYRRGSKGYIDSYDPAEARPRNGPGQLNPTPGVVGVSNPNVKPDTASHAPTPAGAFQRSPTPAGAESPKEQEATVSLRLISPSEVVDVLRTFPEMASYFASGKIDTTLLVQLHPFSEVTSAALTRAFPTVRFCQGKYNSKPPYPYMVAVFGDKREIMPGGFNRLLVDNGLQVTDQNILDLAEVFTILAIGATELPFPQISFLEVKRIAQEIGRTWYSAKLKVKVGARTEEWYFLNWRGQFGEVSRGTEAGQLINQYEIPGANPPQQ